MATKGLSLEEYISRNYVPVERALYVVATSIHQQTVICEFHGWDKDATLPDLACQIVGLFKNKMDLDDTPELIEFVIALEFVKIMSGRYTEFDKTTIDYSDINPGTVPEMHHDAMSRAAEVLTYHLGLKDKFEKEIFGSMNEQSVKH